MSGPVPGWPAPDTEKVPLPQQRGALSFLPRWRIPTWLILIWTGLMVAWFVAAMGAVPSCEGEVGEALDACRAGTAIGGGLAFTMIFIVWFVGFLILALISLMTRPQKRTCPRCGYDVRRGITACPHCDFAFGTEAPAGPWGQP